MQSQQYLPSSLRASAKEHDSFKFQAILGGFTIEKWVLRKINDSKMRLNFLEKVILDR